MLSESDQLSFHLFAVMIDNHDGDLRLADVLTLFLSHSFLRITHCTTILVLYRTLCGTQRYVWVIVHAVNVILTRKAPTGEVVVQRAIVQSTDWRLDSNPPKMDSSFQKSVMEYVALKQKKQQTRANTNTKTSTTEDGRRRTRNIEENGKSNSRSPSYKARYMIHGNIESYDLRSPEVPNTSKTTNHDEDERHFRRGTARGRQRSGQKRCTDTAKEPGYGYTEYVHGVSAVSTPNQRGKHLGLTSISSDTKPEKHHALSTALTTVSSNTKQNNVKSKADHSYTARFLKFGKPEGLSNTEQGNRYDDGSCTQEHSTPQRSEHSGSSRVERTIGLSQVQEPEGKVCSGDSTGSARFSIREFGRDMSVADFLTKAEQSETGNYAEGRNNSCDTAAPKTTDEVKASTSKSLETLLNCIRGKMEHSRRLQQAIAQIQDNKKRRNNTENDDDDDDKGSLDSWLLSVQQEGATNKDKGMPAEPGNLGRVEFQCGRRESLSQSERVTNKDLSHLIEELDAFSRRLKGDDNGDVQDSQSNVSHVHANGALRHRENYMVRSLGSQDNSVFSSSGTDRSKENEENVTDTVDMGICSGYKTSSTPYRVASWEGKTSHSNSPERKSIYVHSQLQQRAQKFAQRAKGKQYPSHTNNTEERSDRWADEGKLGPISPVSSRRSESMCTDGLHTMSRPPANEISCQSQTYTSYQQSEWSTFSEQMNNRTPGPRPTPLSLELLESRRSIHTSQLLPASGTEPETGREQAHIDESKQKRDKTSDEQSKKPCLVSGQNMPTQTEAKVQETSSLVAGQKTPFSSTEGVPTNSSYGAHYGTVAKHPWFSRYNVSNGKTSSAMESTPGTDDRSNASYRSSCLELEFRKPSSAVTTSRLSQNDDPLISFLHGST